MRPIPTMTASRQNRRQLLMSWNDIASVTTVSFEAEQESYAAKSLMTNADARTHRLAGQIR